LKGYISIMFWFIAQFPQIIQNYRNQSVQSLSPVFLLNWILGDSANLIGSILTKQLPTQIYLATYFVIIDIALSVQYIYYKRKAIHSRITVSENASLLRYNSSSNSIKSSESVSKILAVIPFLTKASAMPLNSQEPDSLVQLGVAISWICSVLYLSSRIPQIYRNWKRQSVQGLSISMFIFAALGNLTYTISILLKTKSTEAFYNSLPFLIGRYINLIFMISGGTLLFDFSIFMQSTFY
ncbi:hypothetical protein ROZALSC1DRAFT_8545, partial [Rozella allomycis CSF55]